MTTNPEFTVGMELFTRDGRRVELLAVTKEDIYVVSQVLRIEGYDGDYEYSRGETTFETELFKSAPVAIVDEDLAAAEKRLREIERECSTRMSAAVNAEREVKDRLAKLAKYKGLERLEDFIDGKITHLVYPDEYGPGKYGIEDVSSLDYLDYGRKQGIKLVTLFGKSNGDLAWRVNQYTDGSGGSWKGIIPCGSIEEAQQKRLERIEADLMEHFEHLSPDRPSWFLRLVELAQESGIELSDDITRRYQELRTVELQNAENAALKAVNEAQAKLDALRAKSGAA